ncbi:uncharacterized protein TA16830 [Theileria annulata]|uniref:MtN3-like protein n=1 Tax=Theileria annulata TaxID=5874 RepID=Q4UIK4_THEAN|nr:uncharacterized protein TA16830 [Theileria annulata]CAI73085.1 hypothetical protein, conserved [Theileria annulata]|eukprot:XP_953763.1 hypothetical protein, conserved [Theileria annulata]
MLILIIILVISKVIIADNVNLTDPKAEKPAQPQQPETKIIKIELNDSSSNANTNPSDGKGVQLEEIHDKTQSNTKDATVTPPPNKETIATITLNISNNEPKTIEIKNVDAQNTQTIQNQPKQSVPLQQQTVPPDQEQPQVVETLFTKIAKFITTDFRFLVKFGAVLSSGLTQMIPLNIILTIRKNNSTRNLKCLNFVTSAVSSLSWSLYGILSKNIILIISNFPGSFSSDNYSNKLHSYIYLILLVILSNYIYYGINVKCVGAIINLVGIWVFVKYCSDQNEKFILSVSSKISFVLCLILLVLYFILTSTTFLTVVGLIGGTYLVQTICYYLLSSLLAMSYLSPLFSFKEILESRNTSTMPTEISLGNFISSFFMFCYGFIIWDMLVIGPSFLGVISGLIQLTLLFLFPHSDRIIISEVEILEQPNNFRSMLAMDQEV